MSKKKYTVLVSNDDGIEAAGIKALAKALDGWTNVYVVAPTEQNSATSSKLTFMQNITAETREFKHAKEAYALDGTPADCVKWAIQHYEEKGIHFDFVFSGINMGNNAGVAVIYSGTVAAAREASVNGIRSIALSVNSHEATHFDYICSMLRDLVTTSETLPASTMLSVNAPDVPMYDVKGTRVVPCGEFGYGAKFLYKKNEDGTYRIGTEMYDTPKNKIECDWDALNAGYATITPLTSESLDMDALLQLQGLSNDETLSVFIDLQEKLVPAMRRSSRLETNVVKFAKCLNRLDKPMLVTEQYSKGLGSTVKALRDAMDDYETVDKRHFNCMEEKSFRKAIEGMNSGRIILCGIEAHICLQQTAESLVKRGYEVIIPRDCCASRKKEDFETAMQYLAGIGCKITTWEAIVYEMMGTSQHAAFRKISEIVKGE